MLKTEGGVTFLVAKMQCFSQTCWQRAPCHSKHLNRGLELRVLIYQKDLHTLFLKILRLGPPDPLFVIFYYSP